MTETNSFYRAAIALGTALAPVAGAWNRKIVLGHEGRAASLEGFRQWGHLPRPVKAVGLFHAPSVEKHARQRR